MEERQSDSRDEQRDVEIEAKQLGEELEESYADYLEVAEGRVIGKQERDDMVGSHVEHAVSMYHHQRARNELQEYEVSWDAITAEQVAALEAALGNARNEEDIQRFLSENRVFLVQHLGGGHGRYVLAKPRLGAELVPDFLVAEMSSIGLEWHGIELESPSAKLFKASGEARYQLTHAVQQVMDWRGWLTQNGACARNPKCEDGLGLVGIDADLPATILMGRRGQAFPSNFNVYRRQMKRLHIEIHTYDWLLEQAEHRAKALRESRKRNS